MKYEDVTPELSEMEITDTGLELTGSKRKQKSDAVEYISGIQFEISDKVNTIEKAKQELKQLQVKIKASQVMQALRQLQKTIRESEKELSELASRRSGALGLCKKQGLDISSEIKNIKMLNQ